MTAYEKIREIFDSTRLDVFVMASMHLMSIGWKVAEKVTDEEIARIKGNPMMTDEFCQELMRIAREIARACEPVDFIKFCQVEKIFDIRGFKPRKR